MVRKFGPFDTSQFYEVENRRMQRALAQAVTHTGFTVTTQGAVTAGTGAQLVIAAYPDGALVDGLYVENPASETVTLTTNTNANPRIDRLVMRLDMTAKTIAPFQIVGTPAASPSAPSLVRTATVYDMPLCQYRFPGSASAQNPGSIVDERPFVSRSIPAPIETGAAADIDDSSLAEGSLRGLHPSVIVTQPFGVGVPFRGKVTAAARVLIQAGSEVRLAALGNPDDPLNVAGQENRGTIAEHRSLLVVDTFDSGTADTFTFQPILKSQSGTSTPIADGRFTYSVVEVIPK